MFQRASNIHHHHRGTFKKNIPINVQRLEVISAVIELLVYTGIVASPLLKQIMLSPDVVVTPAVQLTRLSTDITLVFIFVSGRRAPRLSSIAF